MCKEKKSQPRFSSKALLRVIKPGNRIAVGLCRLESGNSHWHFSKYLETGIVSPRYFREVWIMIFPFILVANWPKDKRARKEKRVYGKKEST